MKTQKKYHGVVIPMVTPFTETGKLDEGAAIKLIELIVNGGTFPFILGTTGESASIPVEARFRLVKLVTEFVKQRTIVYAGISDNCLENSLTLANKFFDLGINVFVAHLPSYFPLTTDMMLRHYETLADRCPGEIMIYNIKSTTHMSLPLNVIEKLSHHPKLVGLKDSERDLERLKKLTDIFAQRQDFSLLCGWTAQSANTLQMGFDGIVPSTGNLIPKKFSDLYDAVVRGDQATANKLQAEINPIADLHQKDMLGSEMITGLKVMMNEMGLCEPWVLPPLTRLNSEKENQIKIELKKLI
ncbi:dihydrodipicolinate synthase family protein [candidate division KSB1 bacterium]|nr:dihydrodipicolinate synthase family protein [candidate division KSB1 bacterium]